MSRFNSVKENYIIKLEIIIFKNNMKNYNLKWYGSQFHAWLGPWIHWNYNSLKFSEACVHLTVQVKHDFMTIKTSKCLKPSVAHLTLLHLPSLCVLFQLIYCLEIQVAEDHDVTNCTLFIIRILITSSTSCPWTAWFLIGTRCWPGLNICFSLSYLFMSWCKLKHV